MSKVIVSNCDSYELENLKASIQDAVDAVGGWKKFIQKDQKVLLKVNLIGPKKAEKAATTNPEFVRAVGQLVKAQGAKVYVGDSSGGAIAGMAPTKKSFIVSGIEEVADEEGFTIVNFDEVGPVLVELNDNYNKELYITKTFSEMDVVINLPKMKTHSMGIYTGAIKNLFGAIPGLRKALYHKNAPNPTEFGEVLADIHCAIENMPLHIMDGVISMQGEGPTAGTPYHAGKILVSEDPLALDRIAIEMMGIDPDRVSILSASIRRKIGEWNIDKIEVVGDVSVLEKYQLPKGYTQNIVKDHSKVKKVIDFFKVVPVVNQKKCIGCNSCVDSCPVEAIDRDTKLISYDLCIDCLCCHELCMSEAVDLKSNNKMVGVVRAVSSLFYK
ncbi:MAG: DUF362 domain-containing protein [Clostridia bacterium]|nr:DUF362 domain-containing protein [Clostridia bacterium]